MSLTHTLRHGWHQFFRGPRNHERQRLIDLLRAEYVEEAQDAVQFTHHAQQMYYPEFRERLLRIAAEEHAHVEWLRESIQALGGSLPQITAVPKPGKNSWDCLRMDFEEEKHCCANLLQGLHAAERIDSEIAAGLQRIRREEQRHRDELMDMLLKSEPYAVPDHIAQHEAAQQRGLEREKQAWVAQRKSEWLEHRRREWERNGKSVPWPEWEAQQEAKWTTEAPNRELEWARLHVARDTMLGQSS